VNGLDVLIRSRDRTFDCRGRLMHEDLRLRLVGVLRHLLHLLELAERKQKTEELRILLGEIEANRESLALLEQPTPSRAESLKDDHLGCVASNVDGLGFLSPAPCLCRHSLPIVELVSL
jgi:hypothetical protein